MEQPYKSRLCLFSHSKYSHDVTYNSSGHFIRYVMLEQVYILLARQLGFYVDFVF